MNPLTRFTARAVNVLTEAKPLPPEVTDAIDTVKLWVQGIGGGIAVIGLLILAITLFFSHRHGQGADFMEKAGWWIAGAVLFGLAGLIAPIFLGF
ncbi:TrbC/VirB2 family protein [Paeniglutamicibacter cryotolerans]|uniref:Conjugal transfer protein TrbC n=1 Tax=Paeniglutamicibacter cryotolerans TaxID=670079 RepID=A0A839QPM2_9MICC|nr:TrbC/VirB2 family protein [Paeniglutamicibacter cryotolerans]MBB2997553.1 hypothetical protein [Paeniglutamicibacter cryotolerans]